MEYTTGKDNVHGCSDDTRMEVFTIGNTVAAYDTDEGKKIFLLANEGIRHNCKKGSILSVTKMRDYGTDVDECPTIFTREDKKWRSILIDD